jgi:hypothetical protein
MAFKKKEKHMSSEYIDSCQKWIEDRFNRKAPGLYTYTIGDFYALIRPKVAHFEVRTKHSLWTCCDDAVQLKERIEHDLEQQIRSEIEGNA